MDDATDAPAGPGSIAELFQWSDDMAEKLFGDCPAELAKLARMHLLLTSEFSGMGTAELSCHMVIDSLRKRFGNAKGGSGSQGH